MLASLLTCCGSTAWAEAMAAGAPYETEAACLSASSSVWRSVGPEGGGKGEGGGGGGGAGVETQAWMQAFAAHPKIGDADALREKFKGTAGSEAAFGKMSEHEQKGVEGASEATITALAEGNAEYERRYVLWRRDRGRRVRARAEGGLATSCGSSI
jgi:2-oxo-4-hydroxy-4-carboxy-5-ureidoimidazoline decarboxylase